MKHVFIPGLVAASLRTVSAIVIVVQDQTAPLFFAQGLRSGAVVVPALVMGLKFSVYDKASMACAILFCSVLIYFLGWFLAKVVQFLCTSSKAIGRSFDTLRTTALA